ncbi:hypothetical protein EDD37DRAFT_604239 [Exophiala viscosa]|uniref:uncharacterized protein n=1 Tax=Exophiala viscosa TaxID=2486360 RepID=UPI00219D5578|nr:hypothetical protein EDD37DRAFT_604239 [Exophiala viscosa]
MRNPRQNFEDKHERSQRLPMKVVRGREVIFSCTRKTSANCENVLVKRTVPSRPRRIMLTNSMGPQLNPFIVTMIIQLDIWNALPGCRSRPATTSRRVLLDTGADFNLISHRAFSELHMKKEPIYGLVHSIGGYRKLAGTLLLHWHFSIPGASAGRSSKHCAPFHILQSGKDPNFDCIIGRPWIEENWTEFIALVESNWKNQATARINAERE